MTMYHARLVCFDGDSQVPAAPADDQAAQTAASLAGPDGKISQEQLNKILASERRKNDARIQRVQQTLEQTLESKNITNAEREALQSQLDSVKNETRTEKEKAKAEIEAAKKEATEHKKKADDYQRRFLDSVVERQITDASIAQDAFLPPQMVSYLRPFTEQRQVKDESGKFTGEYQAVTKLPVTDDNGNTVTKEMSPAEAVKAMRNYPHLYGNFFKSGVVSGVGAGQAQGTSMGGGAKLDLKNLTAAQYQKIRAENPELLGLRREKRRRCSSYQWVPVPDFWSGAGRLKPIAATPCRRTPRWFSWR